jgi:hypothetical protein
MDTKKTLASSRTLSKFLKAYEAGKLSDDQTIDLFQALVDLDMIDQLRPEYASTAENMIKDNLICADLNPKLRRGQ